MLLQTTILVGLDGLQSFQSWDMVDRVLQVAPGLGTWKECFRKGPEKHLPIPQNSGDAISYSGV